MRPDRGTFNPKTETETETGHVHYHIDNRLDIIFVDTCHTCFAERRNRYLKVQLSYVRTSRDAPVVPCPWDAIS
jgi:Mg2+ and Co2+ transporter CorA